MYVNGRVSDRLQNNCHAAYKRGLHSKQDGMGVAHFLVLSELPSFYLFSSETLLKRHNSSLLYPPYKQVFPLSSLENYYNCSMISACMSILLAFYCAIAF